MKPAPLVSVIIPTKNEEKVLDACLRSLKNQKTVYSFEVIIVDTKSTDRTLAIAKKYGARIIKESKPGRNIAHQTGANAARGDILCFTEADCQVPPAWIQTLVDVFKKAPTNVAAVGRYTFVDSTPFYASLPRIVMPIGDVLFRLMHGSYPIRASNFAIRAEALKKIGGFNLAAREFDDVELGMRVANIGSIGYVPHLAVQTLDRRFRGRLMQYVREAPYNYFQTCILKRPVGKKTFADIR